MIQLIFLIPKHLLHLKLSALVPSPVVLGLKPNPRAKSKSNWDGGYTIMTWAKEKYQERPRQGSLRKARMTRMFPCKILI